MSLPATTVPARPCVAAAKPMRALSCKVIDYFLTIRKACHKKQ